MQAPLVQFQTLLEDLAKNKLLGWVSVTCILTKTSGNSDAEEEVTLVVVNVLMSCTTTYWLSVQFSHLYYSNSNTMSGCKKFPAFM